MPPVTSRLRVRVGATSLLAAALLGGSVTRASAQAPVPARPGPAAVDAGRGATLTARYHVRQMENVLERAVQHAADMMRRRLQAVTPDVLALAGSPRAQGFRIDGYGLFFSVEVPRLSESMNWALRVLSQDRDERVLASLQKLAAAEPDPNVRADIEQAIRTMQMQLAAVTGGARVPTSPQRRASVTAAVAADRNGAAVADAGNGSAPPAAPAPTAPSPASSQGMASLSSSAAPLPAAEAPAEPLRDPSAAYEDEVKQALVDAMLDYAGSLPLPSAEWVTVAARDAGYVAFPDAVSDMVTVTLSVRASDLADFRAQRLTRDEARTRVVVREF